MSETIKLEWRNAPIPDQQAVEATVRASILAGVSCWRTPEKLIFHEINLTDDPEGPCVIVSGKPGRDAFDCAYHETNSYVPLNALEDCPPSVQHNNPEFRKWTNRT